MHFSGAIRVYAIKIIQPIIHILLLLLLDLLCAQTSLARRRSPVAARLPPLLLVIHGYT